MKTRWDDPEWRALEAEVHAARMARVKAAIANARRNLATEKAELEVVQLDHECDLARIDAYRPPARWTLKSMAALEERDRAVQVLVARRTLASDKYTRLLHEKSISLGPLYAREHELERRLDALARQVENRP